MRLFIFCIISLCSLLANAQAPSNDECTNAVTLTPSTNAVCSTTTAGTTVGATAVNNTQDCFNTIIGADVWYKFVATQTYHKIVIRGATLGYLPNIQFFASTNGTCSNLVSQGCTSNNASGDSTTYKAYNLTIGNTYFVKVYTPSYPTTTTTFNICVTSPPTNIPKPVNDSCQNATILTPSLNANCNAINGTCVGATPSVIDCYSRQSDDVWYKFQAVATHHKVIVRGAGFFGNNFGLLEYRPDECTLQQYYGDCVGSNYSDSASYLLTNITIGNWYYFRVTTDADAANRTFTICVTTPVIPANDECDNAQMLTSHQQWIPTAGTTVDASHGINYNITCNGYNPNDVWYKFTATNSNHEIRVKGIDFVPGGNIQFFNGPCNNLISVGCSGSFSGDSLVYNANGLNVGETYIFRVYQSTGFYGAPFEVCVLSNNDDCESADSVTVNTDYRCLHITTGSTNNATASTQTTCTGNADDDKWYKFIATDTTLNIKLTPTSTNGINNAVIQIFSGNCTALNSIYCVNNTSGTDAEEQLATGLIIGNTYYIRVYSFDNNTGKGDFELCISSPVPANDECSGAILLTPAGELICSNPTSGTTVGATQSAEPACNGTNDDDVWYKFVAIANTHLITVAPAATNGINGTVVQLFSGSCGSLSSLYCQYSGSEVEFNAFNLTMGDTFYIRVHSYDANNGNGDFSICIGTYNSSCAGAQTLAVNPDNNCAAVTSGSTYSNGLPVQPPSCQGTADDNLWYKFVATATTHRVKVTPSASNGIQYPVLETFDGDCGNLTSTSCTFNNNAASAQVEKSMTNLVVGNTYYVRVYSYQNFQGNGDFDICVTTPPVANDECSGAVNLIVTASPSCTNPVSGTTINATQSMPGCSVTTTTYADDDVWYKFTAIGTTTHFALTPVGPNGLFDPVMQLFQTDNCGAIGNVGSGCADNLPGTGAFDFRNPTTPGATYYFRIYSAANGTGQGDFTICTYFDGPSNDDCGGAINVPVNNDNICTLTTAGTTVNATSSNAPGGCTSNPFGASPDDDVWYKFIATSTAQKITVTPTASGGIDNAVLRFYYNNCNNLNSFECINNTTGADAETYTAQGLTIGNTYYFSVHSYLQSYGTAGEGAFIVCITSMVGNDECTGAYTLPVNDNGTCTNTYQGTNLNSSNSNPATGCASGSYDVWYKFTANKTAYHIAVTPSATGGIINPRWNLYSGTCNNLVSLVCSSQPATAENLQPGNTYYLRVSSDNGNPQSMGAFSICIKSLLLENDVCSGAVNVPISNADTCITSVQGTTVGALYSVTSNATDVWYKFTATAAAHKIKVSPTADSIKSVAFEVYSGNCTSLSSMAYVDYYAGLGTDTAKAELQSIEGFTAGQTYYIRIFSSNYLGANSTGSFKICVSLANNDVCTYAKTLTVNNDVLCNNETVDSTDYATVTYGAYYCNDLNNTGRDMWYKFTALDTIELITFHNLRSGINGFQVFSGSCGSLSSLMCSNNIRQPIGGLIIGNTYYVRVYRTSEVSPAKYSICISKTAINNECVNAINVTVNTVPGCTLITNGSTAGSTVSQQPVCGNFYNGSPPIPLFGNDVWYKFMATSAQLKVTLTGITPDLNIFFSVYSGSCNSLNQIVCVNDYAPLPGSTDEEAMALDNLITGNTYYIRVFNQAGIYTTGDFTICITNVDPLNDLCSNAVTVPVNNGDNCTQTITGNNLAATRSYDAPYINGGGCAPEFANADLFYKFIATDTSLKITITPTANGGIDDVMFQVYSGNCGTLSQINFTDRTGGNREEVTRLDNLTIGSTYFIRVSNGSGLRENRGAFNICINKPPLNDVCSNAELLAVNADANCAQQTTGTTVAATPNGNEDVWYKFVATATEHKISVNSTGLPNPAFALYKGNCNGLTQIREDINYDAGGASTEFQAYDSLVIGNTYYIRVWSSLAPSGCTKNSNTNFTGSFTICVSATSQPNDVIDSAITVPVNNGTVCTNAVTGTNAGSTYSFNKNDCYNRVNAYLYPGQFYLSDVWYKFTATAPSHIITVTPSTTGGIHNPAFAVYERMAVNIGDNLLQRGCINLSDADNDAESQSLNGLTPGKTYYIRVMSDIRTSLQGVFTICITTPVLPVYNEKIITYAGNGSGIGVSVTNSKLYKPTDVAVDKLGNVYIADSARIKKINAADGVVTVIAGTGEPGFSGDNGPAVNAKIASKLKIAVDNIGNVFIADFEGVSNTDNTLVAGFGRVRKIAAGTGIISSIINLPTDLIGFTSLPPLPIYLSRRITGITTDAANNIFITVNRTQPFNSAPYPLSKWYNIYKQTPTGVFTELLNGSHYAYGLTVDAAGALYFATAQGISPCPIIAGGIGPCFDGTPAPFDTRYIRKILPDGSSQIIAGQATGFAIIGQGPFGYTGDGGPAINAQLKPIDVKADAAGNLYVADGNGFWNGVEYGNYVIRKINTAGIINTIAGTGVSNYTGDEGPAQQASLHTPLSLAVDSTGNVYITDIFENNATPANRIRKILAECSSGIADKNEGNTFYVMAPITINKECDTIARISNLSPAAFNRDVTAKVWIESTVPYYNSQPYVARHYEITPLTNPSAAGARITLYFTQPEFTAYNVAIGAGTKLPANPTDATGIANLKVVKRDGVSSNGTGLQETYGGTMTIIDPADADIIWNNLESRWEVSFVVSSFSGFFVQTTQSPLPLTLLNFTGQKQTNAVLLSWLTTKETNTSHFILQRSTNGTSFSNIGRVEAKNWSGNNTYNFTDINPLPGVNFYRLQMVDKDGKFMYSPIIRIDFKHESQLQLYPNPVHDYVSISGVAPGGIIRIVNTNGAVVKQLPTNANSITITMDGLSSGVYICQYTNGTKIINEKLIKE